MYKCIAYDPESHAPRVWGTGATEKEAREQCRKELAAYIRKIRWQGFCFGDFDFKVEEITEETEKSQLTTPPVN
jgi:hypothetical protein